MRKDKSCSALAWEMVQSDCCKPAIVAPAKNTVTPCNCDPEFRLIDSIKAIPIHSVANLSSAAGSGTRPPAIKVKDP